MKQIFRFLCLLFALVSCLITSGCSHRDEAGNLAVVTGIYVDYSLDRKTYTILAEVADFSGYEKASTLSARWLEASGKTLSDALFQLQKKSSNPLYFSHAKLLFFGKGFQVISPKNTIDFFLNYPDINSDVLLCLANATAEELKNHSKETISGKIFETIKREYNTKNCRLYRLFGNESSTFFLPEITLSNDKNHVLSTAVFSDYLYITSYQKQEDIIYRLLADEIQNEAVSTKNFDILILKGTSVLSEENGHPTITCTLSVRIEDTRGTYPLTQLHESMKQELIDTLTVSFHMLYQDLERKNQTSILWHDSSLGNLNIRFFITAEETRNLKGR